MFDPHSGARFPSNLRLESQGALPGAAVANRADQSPDSIIDRKLASEMSAFPGWPFGMWVK
jgi:hypothetical protein